MFNELLNELEAVELSIEIGKLFIDKSIKSIEEALAMHVAFMLRRGIITEKDKFINRVEVIIKKMNPPTGVEDYCKHMSH